MSSDLTKIRPSTSTMCSLLRQRAHHSLRMELGLSRARAHGSHLQTGSEIEVRQAE